MQKISWRNVFIVMAVLVVANTYSIAAAQAEGIVSSSPVKISNITPDHGAVRSTQQPLTVSWRLDWSGNQAYQACVSVVQPGGDYKNLPLLGFTSPTCIKAKKGLNTLSALRGMTAADSDYGQSGYYIRITVKPEGVASATPKTATGGTFIWSDVSSPVVVPKVTSISPDSGAIGSRITVRGENLSKKSSLCLVNKIDPTIGNCYLPLKATNTRHNFSIKQPSPSFLPAGEYYVNLHSSCDQPNNPLSCVSKRYPFTLSDK